MSNQTTTEKNSWQVYILRCVDGSLYTGITTNLARRLQEHNGQTHCAARYTRSRQPVELVYHEPACDRTAAAKREYRIKQLSRPQKLALANSVCEIPNPAHDEPTACNSTWELAPDRDPA
ncbi:MAG TPA: GIY-YIG nuclease family protein [Gammaproteobacteria bacterium]|nr:GIY-YIG nuclease family protein [Gammaproteobacteria bacterium]